MNSPSKYQLPILLYNHECDFCNRFKMALERIPGTNKINMVSIHENDVFEQFDEIKFEECKETIHLIDKNMRVHMGPEVAKFLIEEFPGVKKFSWLLESEIGKKAVEAFYKFAEKCKESISKNCPNCR